MAESLKLTSTLRKVTGKGAAKRLRKKGMIPAILYGHKTSPIPLTIEEKQFTKLIVDSKSEHKLFTLHLAENGGEEKTVMIKEIQVDPVHRTYLHVDLFEISMDEEITISIPIKLTGEAEGVKIGGVLQQVRRELAIKCLPRHIPEALEIDVSALGIGDSIHLQDVHLPEGIKVLEDADLTIVTILAPTVEKEVAEVVTEAKAEEVKAAAPGEPEEKKGEGKKVEEGDKSAKG